MEKRLGYIANSILYHEDGQYYYRTGEYVYLIRIAELFDIVEVNLRIEELGANDKLGMKELTLTNAIYHDMHSVPKSDMRRRAERWTMGFFMAPNWMALYGRGLSRTYGFPYVLCLRGEWTGVLGNSIASRGLPVWPFKPAVSVIGNRIERILLRDASMRLTNLFSLWSKYPEYAETFIESLTMTIERDRFMPREDTCQNEEIRMVSIGVLSQRKGYDITLEALKRLRDSGFHVVFDVIGNGPEEDNLKKRVDEYGLNDSVFFHGFLVGDAKWNVIEEADIFMHNSHSEGFPRVIYEAYAKSLPAIVTAVGGVAYRLQNGRDATVIDPGSVEETVSSIRKVITDEGYRKTLIVNGHTFAKKLFEVHPVERAVEAIRAKWPDLIKN